MITEEIKKLKMQTFYKHSEKKIAQKYSKLNK